MAGSALSAAPTSSGVTSRGAAPPPPGTTEQDVLEPPEDDQTLAGFPARTEPLPREADGPPGCSDSDVASGLRPTAPKDVLTRAKSYSLAAGARLATLVAVFVVLFALFTLIRYRVSMPEPHDYHDLQFDWTPFDPRYLEPLDKGFGQYNVLADTHSHTTFSDGSRTHPVSHPPPTSARKLILSRMAPAQLVSWAKVNGFDALIVSDHNTLEGALATRDWAAKNEPGFIVIPAMEYSSCRVHMNLIGIDQMIELAPAVPTNDELKRMIDKVHSLGGIVSVNHIPWSNTTNAGFQVARLPNHPSRDELLAMGVDAFEVTNQGEFDTISWAFARSRNATSGRPLGAFTGSDVHYPESPAWGWTAVNVAERTAEAVLEELRNARNTILFEPSGTRGTFAVRHNPAYLAVEPLDALASYSTIFYEVKLFTGRWSGNGRLSRSCFPLCGGVRI
ncbi:MAG: polymerase/histidinol phosphatase-like protein [Olpidium bornovanus]|uniref:Polymerase/histidinol phosphatase-like protein n=1 Tax=Olpidium bornovanus TaxID=278681 RepID=A0A8H8DL30_9FUNG|nr:MAG: polymerase/histidinol phosphatase-like protein [Olpidium bornovanus]